MITDRPPTESRARAEYDASDALRTFAPPPPPEAVQLATARLLEAVAGGGTTDVRKASDAVLEPLAEFFGVAPPTVRVLGVRPHTVHEGVTTYQLFGDYQPQTAKIRVWMRTAIQQKVSSPRSFLATLLHEFCHHLDCAQLAWPESFHTRGFYERIDQLYHLSLATPEAARRPLHWVKAGAVWRIDWTRSRAPRG